MKPRIKLAFCDMWRNFNPQSNYFMRLLAPHFDVQLTDRPDFVIYGCSGHEHRRHRCTRIFFSGENWRPNFRVCDFAFTFDHHKNPCHYRLPSYGLYGDPHNLVKRDWNPRQILAQKSVFCNFIYSNPLCATRNRFFRELSKYKRVESGGKLYNNIGGRIDDKLSLVRKSKFTIAFENESHAGYTTEKLGEPMHAQSLPIYWGNKQVHLDFNPKSFINTHNWPSLEAAIEHVIAVDRDDELYCQYLEQPWYHNNRVNQYVDPANVLARFNEIFLSPPQPIAISHRVAKVFHLDLLRDVRYSMTRRIKRSGRKIAYRLAG
ncbi:MAG TPA: glycosyltransferase family 10 [Pirellulales bacterium]|jgi:hypothetical protein